jgi:hypothetical protein
MTTSCSISSSWSRCCPIRLRFCRCWLLRRRGACDNINQAAARSCRPIVRIAHLPTFPILYAWSRSCSTTNSGTNAPSDYGAAISNPNRRSTPDPILCSLPIRHGPNWRASCNWDGDSRSISSICTCVTWPPPTSCSPMTPMTNAVGRERDCRTRARLTVSRLGTHRQGRHLEGHRRGSMARPREGGLPSLLRGGR